MTEKSLETLVMESKQQMQQTMTKQISKERRQEIIREFVRHNGHFNPALFVREVRATGAEHPAHGWFEWNINKAAEQHWRWQARQLLIDEDVPAVEVPMEYLSALRKAAGLHINPETAEVEWCYAQTLDPYGDDPDLPEEFQQVGREYFARSPGSDVWIEFGDLPEATRDALWEKHKRKLAFPAGLEELLSTAKES